MRTRIGRAVVVAIGVLVLLTACSTANPDPRPGEIVPVTVQAPIEAVTVDPSLSVVSGRVLTVAGAPLEGARVTLRMAGTACATCGRLTGSATGADGTFSLAVPNGTYSIACTAGGSTTCWLDRTADRRQASLRVAGPVSGLRFTAPPVHRSHPR